jgi:hypothetical protein
MLNANQLNGAVRECLERCYASRDWLACLADYGERLRADGWPRPEIEDVELAVQQILAAVLSGDSMTPGHNR